MTTAWTITERRGFEGFRSLEADWRRLYVRMPRRTHLLSYEACAGYLEHCLEQADRVRCLAVGDGREIQAICLLEPRTEHRLGLPVACWGGLWLSTQSLYADVLCPDPGLRRQLAPLLAGYLRSHPEGRRLLALGPLERDADLWTGLDRLVPAGLAQDGTERIRILDCRRPFAQLEAGLSKNFRHSLNAARKRLAALPDVRFQAHRGPAAVAAALPAFLDLEASGWKGEAMSSILHRRGLADYYAHLATSLDGDQDACEIHTLHADGRCLAATFITLTGSTCAAIKIAFDQDYRRVSPGQILAARVIERCCADPRIDQINYLSEAPWLGGWPSHLLDLQVVFLNIGGPVGRCLATLLRLRLGPLRRLVRWLQARRRRPAPRPATAGA